MVVLFICTHFDTCWLSLFLLNFLQVLNLLDAMGMKQYTEAFKNEDINGKVLLECDDSVLANDLRVSSKLHRIRLLKVVSGEFSAKEIIQKSKDLYVSMFPVS